MKLRTITIKWRVTPEKYKELADVAKQWGQRSPSAYMKSLITTKLGKIEQ